MPGIADVVAQGILAEIGLDMSRFPSHRHLLSWACLCPRLDLNPKTKAELEEEEAIRRYLGGEGTPPPPEVASHKH
jgi:hypothetical protein